MPDNPAQEPPVQPIKLCGDLTAPATGEPAPDTALRTFIKELRKILGGLPGR